MRKSFFVGLLAAVALIPGAAFAQEEGDRFEPVQRLLNEGGPRFQPSESRPQREFRAPPQFQPPQAQPQFQRPDRAFNQPRADVPQVMIDRRPRQFDPPVIQQPGQPQVQPQFPQRGFQPGRPGEFRPDRPTIGGDRRDGRPDWRQDRGTFGGGVQPAPQVRGPQPDFRADRRDERPDFRRDQRPDFRGDQRPDFRADRRDDRQDFRRDQRPDFRGDNRPGFRDDFRRDFRGDNRQGFRGDFRQDFRGAYRNQPNYRGDGRFGNGFRGAWNRDWRRDNRWNWQSYRSFNRDIFRLPRYYAPYGWNFGYRRFAIGYTLNSILFDQRYWISDPYFYHLPEAYYPYEWVRYYNDALLVDVESGEVVDVVYGIFY